MLVELAELIIQGLPLYGAYTIFGWFFSMLVKDLKARGHISVSTRQMVVLIDFAMHMPLQTSIYSLIQGILSLFRNDNLFLYAYNDYILIGKDVNKDIWLCDNKTKVNLARSKSMTIKDAAFTIIQLFFIG